MSQSALRPAPTDDPNRRLEMKNKEEKAQETDTRRLYEKPVLVVISTAESRGKVSVAGEFVSAFASYGPS